jgi:transcriptional regulator with XRE-family HTH domain
MSFAVWVRETRMRKGLQVSECAIRAGVGQSTWSEYESSSPQKEWRKATVLRIAAGLGVDADTALLEARLLPKEEPVMEQVRKLGPIVGRAPPDKQPAIWETLANVAEQLVTIAAV